MQRAPFRPGPAPVILDAQVKPDDASLVRSAEGGGELIGHIYDGPRKLKAAVILPKVRGLCLQHKVDPEMYRRLEDLCESRLLEAFSRGRQSFWVNESECVR